LAQFRAKENDENQMRRTAAGGGENSAWLVVAGMQEFGALAKFAAGSLEPTFNRASEVTVWTAAGDE